MRKALSTLNLLHGESEISETTNESSFFDSTSVSLLPQPNEELLLVENQKISERFILHKQLGKGGFGQVWEANDSWLNQQVALKLSKTNMLNEVNLLRKLPKERYISVFDYVKDKHTDSYGYTMEILAHPWMTLDEYYENKLRTKFEKNDYVFAIKQIIYIAVDLLTSLSHLHGKKHSNKNSWYHADIKPNNLYVHSKDANKFIKKYWGDPLIPVTKIGDLGLSGEAGTPVSTGTPGYRAPEQNGYQAFSHKGDIYAMGQTLIYLISGELIEGFSSSIYIHVNTIQTCILEQIPSRYLALRLTRIIRKMTYKTPNKRPSAEELVNQLRKIISTDDDWTILSIFSDKSVYLTKPEAARELFDKLKKSKAWKNYTANRQDEMKSLIRNAYKNNMLKLKGKSYSLR
jgi:serine/threonine protein kinase